MKTLKFLLVLTIFMVGPLFQSCDDPIEEPEAPELPPLESMVVNFDNFPATNSGRQVLESGNHQFAAGNVFIWHTLLVASLIVPATAFERAFDQEFIYLRDSKRWKSEYIIKIGAQEFTVTLFSRLNGEGDQVLWEMYLSANGFFDDFKWVTGSSNTDRSGGTWMINKGTSTPANPANPQEVTYMEIEWTNVDERVIATFTMVEDGARYENSFIQFGSAPEGEFTHFYTVYVNDHELSNTYNAEIQFNQQDGTGRVKSVNYFQDEEWHCWDSALENMECPAPA